MQNHNDWITDRKSELKKIYNECQPSETAIKTYLVSLQHLLNEIDYTDSTEFHYYEKNMLYDAINLFSKQFLSEIEQALASRTNTEKRALLLDLEDALVRILDVIKNTIDSTSNTDRQIFTSLAIDTNVYNLSPKLCNFYSSMLQEVVDIFRENDQDRDYAFLLNPSVRYNTAATQILTHSDAKSRIMVIYISESSMEAIDIVPILLLHEAFHLITRQRNRRFREKKLAQLMAYGLKQQIFQDADIADSEQEMLLPYLLSKLKDEMNKLNKEENEKEFYSEEIVKRLDRVITESLYSALQTLESITLLKHIQSNIHKKEDFENFNSMYARIQAQSGKIQRNICDIIFHGTVRNMLDMYMRIFREGYADMALVQTLQIPPDIYNRVFDESVRFTKVKDVTDLERNLRTYLVGNAIKKHIETKTFLWTEFTKETEPESKWQDIQTQNNSPYENVALSPYMLNAFTDYFSQCAEDFSKLLKRRNTHGAVDNFRKKVYDIVTSKKKTDIIMNILAGNEFFDKLDE